MQIKTTKEKNSVIELEITIPATEFMAYWDRGFAAIASEANIDGFRKGKAPAEAVIAKYGEMSVLQEMADIAINDTYSQAVMQEKLKIISAPSVHIVKLAKDNDFMYHAHVEVMPEITLPDYKALATDAVSKKNVIEDTTEEEIKTILAELSPEVKEATPDIEEKIKENLKTEKEYLENSRVRSLFLESLVKGAQEKNVDEFPKSFDDRMTAQFLVLAIAKELNIKAEDSEIEAEVVKIMASADPSELAKSQINDSHVRSYAEQIIINEKVLKDLGI